VVERVAVIGGGIGGLAVALALAPSKRSVVIIERDPEPPAIEPGEAFERWQRPGVPQFRHAHILLGRLQTILRDHYPELLAELRGVGLELSSMQELLPDTLRSDFEPLAEDAELLHLWGRRATFEYVLRQHVGKLPNVRFLHGVRAVGLATVVDARKVRVCGVEIARGDARELIEAELVVDAAGKRSKSAEWLQAVGVKVEVERKPSEFVYACRHYRLRDPKAEPPRLDGGGNLDYLGYSTFYAEQGHYALTFGCPEQDRELADVICTPEGFDALCRQFPVLARRTAESEVTSKVLGAGRFENRWTRYGVRGGRQLLGFFAVGDSYLETNPMYGRGCASAFVQAHVLAEALNASGDAAARARLYQRRTHALLQPYFEISSNTDHIYHVRADMRRGVRLRLPDRVLNFLYENAFVPASRSNPVVAREFLRAVQMREVSSVGRRLAVILQVLGVLVRSLFGLSKAALPAPPPPRDEFLRKITSQRDAPRLSEHDAPTP
jgi:2-polyprenyl-6-methoxyphenol hydroxylase-like FAD-dependent oxidoreductase